jgi:cell wall-associated NlpC family hydrolase
VPAPRTTARPSGARPAGSAARPPLSAAEAHALREALALRHALAARQGVAAGSTATRPAAPARAPAARKPARKPAARKAAATKPTVRISAAGSTVARGVTTGTPVVRKGLVPRPGVRTTTTAKRTKTRTTRKRAARTQERRTRRSIRLRTLALSAIVLPAVASLALPGSQVSTSGPHDVATLALTAHSTLVHQAARYQQLEQQVASKRVVLRQARAAQQAVSRAQQPSTVLVAATKKVAAASSAVAAVVTQADAVLAESRATVAALSPAVTIQLSALEVAQTRGAQQARNAQALSRWQDYVRRLGAAGIPAPPAAALADPTDLPAGLSAALGTDGTPVAGVAAGADGDRSITVLPAETIAAVSTALSQLGKPYAAGTTGPGSYDCGGLASASWLLAGYALPPTPQQQWAAGAAVPMSQLQVGDLVFAPSGTDVGIYLGHGEVLGASAGSDRVDVHGLAAGSSAVRVTLPAPARPNAPLMAASRAGACGAALPAGGSNPAWGGWSNGKIPSSALCLLGVAGHKLRCDAAASYQAMSTAYAQTFGHPLCITDSYRSYAAQAEAFRTKPALAAVPGTSNHGWGLAVDLCDGINVPGTPQGAWMAANAGRFGFVHPDWAAPGAEKPEPWHWEYGYLA